jgi:single-strand DNA-binding protein
MGVNSVTLVGRAGRDPEVRYFESGTVVANLDPGREPPQLKR